MNPQGSEGQKACGARKNTAPAGDPVVDRVSEMADGFPAKQRREGDKKRRVRQELFHGGPFNKLFASAINDNP